MRTFHIFFYCTEVILFYPVAINQTLVISYLISHVKCIPVKATVLGLRLSRLLFGF